MHMYVTVNIHTIVHVYNSHHQGNVSILVRLGTVPTTK